MRSAIRLTVAMTHPIQYYSPWFRFIAREASELELHVVYASAPTPDQQGAQFATGFEWDVPLRDGYDNEVLRPAGDGAEFGSESFWGVDAPGMGRAIEAASPDVVLLSGWHSASLVRAMLACRRRGIPLLYRGDSNLGNRARSFAWRIRTRFFLGRFERYLSVGTRAREYLRHFGVDDGAIHESPHAVDNAFFAERSRPYREAEARAAARRELDVAADAFVVLFVGKLEPKKCLGDLLRALPHLAGPATLVVAGSGPLESDCRELVSDLDLDVRFIGFVNQGDLGRVYAVADCLVLPSGWGETWGLVVNEAMACGVPCVVSDRVGCAPDLAVSGETGEVFPFGDREELARAVDRVRETGDRARACKEHVKRFSFASATEGLVAACRGVVA